MATARIEAWPGGPESRAYTADGRVNRPPGWEPPPPEHRDEVARFIREHIARHVAREAEARRQTQPRTQGRSR